MKFNIKFALILAARNEIDRIKIHLSKAELASNDEILAELREEDIEFWKAELADIQEAYDYLRDAPVEYDNTPVN